MSRQGDVTRLLVAVSGGDAMASAELLPVVYEELRALARRKMAAEMPGHTLQPTALVHEAYLRLVGGDDLGWNGRGHFFAAAAEAMRRILVERARRYRRVKHGEGKRRVPLHENEVVAIDESVDLLALNRALEALQQRDQRMHDITMLRYFAGLTVEQTADALGISVRQVARDWRYARLWLAKFMEDDTTDD